MDTHLFNKHLLNTWRVLGTVMGSGDTGAGREWWGDRGNLIVDFKGIYSLEKEAEIDT